MAGRQPATVKVLHRATDEVGSDGDSPTNFHDLDAQQQVQKLLAENESLKQRLDQAKATSASERKRLADELKIERAGRQRAEELVVKQAKELESVTAAKGRLEDAFSRSMSELRYTRSEYAQAEKTIQQLLRELMLLRDIINRITTFSSAASSSTTLTAGSSNGGSSSSSDLAEAPGGKCGAAAGSIALSAAAAGQSNKRISRSKLLGELQQLRQAKAAAELKRDSLLQRLGALEAEKERAEESQEMISRETAKLLDDKRKLLNDLGSKDEAVRGLEAGLDHLQHQLELALNDRQLLLEQLTKVADKSELEALQVVMEDGDSSSYLNSPGDEEYTQEQQQHEHQHQLLLQELEQMQLQHLQGEGLGEGVVA